MQPDRLRDDVSHPPARIETCKRILENELDAPTHCSQTATVGGRDVGPIEFDRASCIRVLRGFENVLDRPDLNNSSSVHDRDPIRRFGDHPHVVRDEHDSRTPLAAQSFQQCDDLLLRYDRNFKYEPCLATFWERIEPTIWRFHLRRNVKFDNGNDFTADDVVASLTRASHPNSPYVTATSQIQEARKVDDYTVDVVLKGKYALILNDLAGVFIMDKEWMEQNNAL